MDSASKRGFKAVPVTRGPKGFEQTTITFTHAPALWAPCYVCGARPVVACRRFAATGASMVVADVCEAHRECGFDA